jgi:membrane protein YqaA with SNARE-associated domain
LNIIKHFIAEYLAFFKHVLAATGIWGAFIIATMDSAAFGIPMDPVMIGYAWGYRDQLWMVAFAVLLGSAGSALGSLVPYWIGRKGGEPLLLKRITHERLEELRDRYESWEFLFVMIPSMLPPPTPMKLIVMAAGAFEMRVQVLLLALMVGRTLRLSILSFFVIRYGQQIVDRFREVFQQHAPILYTALAAIALSGFLLWRWRTRTNRDRASRQPSAIGR